MDEFHFAEEWMMDMFQARLKELREGTGLSQKALAERLGIAQSTVGMWESGKNKPEYDTLLQIADLFGVSVDDLMGREPKDAAVSEEAVKAALFGGAGEVTDAMWEEAKSYIEFLKDRERKKRE